MPDANQWSALLDTAEPASLGPAPRPGRQSLQALDQALSKAEPIVHALVLLWHDYLDESHSLSQDIPTPDASFVHGIMHRREPDYGNAKYWFRRVGEHPTFPAIAKLAAELPQSPDENALLQKFCKNGRWDAFAFIDCCQEEYNSGSPGEQFLQRVQKAEFTALLDHLATGAS
jgi:hypothetical protein